MLHTPCNSLGHLGHNLYLTVIGTIYLFLINWCPLFESLSTSALTDHSTYSQEEYLRSSTNPHTYYYVDTSIHIPPKTFFANWLRYPQIYLATFTSFIYTSATIYPENGSFIDFDMFWSKSFSSKRCRFEDCTYNI